MPDKAKGNTLKMCSPEIEHLFAVYISSLVAALLPAQILLILPQGNVVVTEC